jgi:hypothetical protein
MVVIILTDLCIVRVEVLTTVNMKNSIAWDIKVYSLMKIN